MKHKELPPTEKSCCTPTRLVSLSNPEGVQQRLVQGESHRSDMVFLSGGQFLMDTDFPHDFPGDGKGSVRPVE
jgi:hypothetical protein